MKHVFPFLLISAPLLAQSQPHAGYSQEFSGYLKTLASQSRSYFTRDAWGDAMERIRLTYDGKYGGWLNLHMDYDNEIHAGNLIPLPDFAVIRNLQGDGARDLRYTIVDQDHIYWDTSLYRGYVEVRKGPAVVTAGRQRIGWGTARFFSPMDLFNPVSPLQIEPNERQGVNAGRLQVRLPGELRGDLVFARDGEGKAASGVRASRTIGTCDIDAAVARINGRWMTGWDFAGQFHGAGLRGELTYRWDGVVRFAAGADYAFPNSLYLVGEYFYNQGQVDSAEQVFQFANEILTRNRHFLSGGASYDLTPLWKLETYVVADLAGPSAAVLPRLTHSLSGNTDLSFGGEFFVSSRDGEFHGLSELVYAELVYHFR